MAVPLTAAALPAAASAILLLAACSPEPAPPAADNRDSRVANSSAPPLGSSSASLAPLNEAARAAPSLVVEGGGLRLLDRQSGAARPLAFGLARAQVMQALEFRRGAETGTNSECGAGPLDHASWRDGLTLYFQHGRFVGWAVKAPEQGAAQGAFATAAGIGLGSTRAELERAYEAEVFESSLGTEFAAGKLFGLLDGTGARAKITTMWAGASCNFR